MDTRILAIAISGLILACGAVSATAQDRITPPLDQQQIQPQAMGHEGASAPGQGGMMHDGMMGEGMAREGTVHGGIMHRGMMEGMTGGGMMGRQMIGGGMMGSPIMLRMIFALMDGDGDGTVSLQEFQAAHERIFKAMDSNKDGVLTFEEMLNFMHGTRGPALQQ